MWILKLNRLEIARQRAFINDRPQPKNLTQTSCFRVLASALQRYPASRAIHASARKYNMLCLRLCTLLNKNVQHICYLRSHACDRQRMTVGSWRRIVVPDRGGGAPRPTASVIYSPPAGKRLILVAQLCPSAAASARSPCAAAGQ